MHFLTQSVKFKKLIDYISGIDRVDIKSFDLNLLRVLDALLQEGSTVKAGERIGLSQPAVSSALGRLRFALKDELFLRKGQGLEPTDFARSLAIPVRQKLEDIEALLLGPRNFDAAKANITFRLTGSDFFAEMLLPEMAKRLAQQAPGIKVQFLGLVPYSYLEAMERFDIDIALVPTLPMKSWVQQSELIVCPFKVIARKNNQKLRMAGLAAGDSVPLELYCALRHVLFSSDGNLTTFSDDALAQTGHKRDVVMSMPFFSGVHRAVAESDLVALVPEQLASRLAPKLGLVLYDPPIEIQPVQLSMIWHRRSNATPAHRWIRQMIIDIMNRAKLNSE